MGYAMFLTTPEAEHTLLSRLFGARHWSYVEVDTEELFYCVRFWEEEEGCRIGRTLLLSNHLLLIDLTEQLGPVLKSVEVVLPGHYTGEDGWTMQPLRAIWRGVTPEGEVCLVHVTRSDRRYTGNDAISHERDLNDSELIFNFLQKSEQPHAPSED